MGITVRSHTFQYQQLLGRPILVESSEPSLICRNTEEHIGLSAPLSSSSTERAQAWLLLQKAKASGDKAVGFVLDAASPALQALRAVVKGA